MKPFRICLLDLKPVPGLYHPLPSGSPKRQRGGFYLAVCQYFKAFQLTISDMQVAGTVAPGNDRDSAERRMLNVD